MPPYRNPRQDVWNTVNFVRAGERIYVGRILLDSHPHIVKIDDLKPLLAELRRTNPAQADAGTIRVSPRLLTIFGGSDEIKLPMRGHSDEARRITAETFRAQSPGREIKF